MFVSFCNDFECQLNVQYKQIIKQVCVCVCVCVCVYMLQRAINSTVSLYQQNQL